MRWMRFGERWQTARPSKSGFKVAVRAWNRENWWTWPGSNRRPLPRHGSSLPVVPQACCEGWKGTDIASPRLQAERWLRIDQRRANSKREGLPYPSSSTTELFLCPPAYSGSKRRRRLHHDSLYPIG